MKKISKLEISFLEDKEILEFSKGEVKKPETINYRTLNPEKKGLFCQKIFGPIKDKKCNCITSNIKKKNHRCKICKKKTIKSTKRRSRMGHIKLNIPLVHIWLYKVLPSKLNIILNIKNNIIENIIYYKCFIVTKTQVKEIKIGTLVKINEYNKMIIKFGNNIKMNTGAKAIKKLLKNINIKKEINFIKKIKNKKYNKKIILKEKILKKFNKKKKKLDSLIINYIPVLPPELRPLINMGDNKFITSDLNELYKRIISRNNRIKKLTKISAPDFIILNEKRLLQEAFDCLIENGKKTISYKSENKIPLKSLADNIKGKKGRFRQNLLGKRVDYSGRAVIVVDPKIKLNECKIPQKILKELFKPYIYGYIVKNKIKKTIKSAIKISKNKKVLKKIIKVITKNHPIILNRAPTLHKLNIQAFKIKITKTSAIKINPLICKSFNADFDGDQMAIHIPLTIESINETKKLLIANKNIFLPSNNRIAIKPTQEIVLGIYLLTKKKNNNIIRFKKNRKIFSKKTDIICYLLNNHNKKIYEEVYFKIENVMIKTTLGRILFFYRIKEKKLLIKYNKTLKKKQLDKLIEEIGKKYNFKKKTIIKKINLISKIGFEYATNHGKSISLTEIISKSKTKKKKDKYIKKYIKNKEKFVFKINKKKKLLISDILIYKKIIKKTNKEIDLINKTKNLEINNKKFKYKKNNSIQEIIKSGAKGTSSQMFQIINMRGLVMKKNNEIINFPIFSSLEEGVGCNEFFVSTFGARKGLADTAIKTAESGYLTRRLIDAVQNIIIKKTNCKSEKGIKIKHNEKNINCYIGKITQKNIYNKKGKIIKKKNKKINKRDIKKITKNKCSFYIKTAIFCKLKNSICEKCYGKSINKNNKTEIGKPVGIIAAQSIGEPGTQLTMRTFHTGGILNNNKKNILLNKNIYCCFFKQSTNLRTTKKNYVINNGNIFLLNFESKILKKIKIMPGNKIIKNNKFIKKKKTWKEKKKIKSIIEGKYNIKNIKKKNIIMKLENKDYLIISLKNTKKTKPKIVIKNKKTRNEINIFSNEIIIIPKKLKIKKGFILKYKLTKNSDNKEITDKLKKISSILEAINQKKKKNKYKKITMFKNRTHCYKQEKKNFIKLKLKGEIKNNQNIKQKELIKINGIENFSKYLIYKIRNMYLEFGINIDIKHFELIIERMTSLAELISKNKKKKEINRKEAISKKKKIKNKITGLTKISLKSKSFISSASFQETIKILVNSAIEFKSDKLKGVKENVIIGSKIPIGTGFFIKKYENIKSNK